MAEKLLNAADIPKRIVEPYKRMILGLRAKGQTRNLPDLKYKGNSFFLDYKKGDKAFSNNWSPKNRALKYATDAKRRASTNGQVISRQDYRDFAKKNGYTQQHADLTFQWKENILEKLQNGKGNLNYEHFTPTTSQAYGGVEHPRNIGLLDKPTNGSKSDKLMSSADARKLGIPLSKQSAIQKDFNNVPIVDQDVQMQNVLEAVNKPKVKKAQFKNKLFSSARAKVIAKRLNVPFIGGAVAAGIDLTLGGNAASAAGSFVDAENPIDGGPLANGSLAANTPEAVEARRQQLAQERQQMYSLIQNTGKQVLNFLLHR